jgi:glycosyltransferase involved in cell wall biosynthesis
MLKIYNGLARMLASQIICISHYIAAQFTGATRAKVRVLYNGLPEHQPPPQVAIVSQRREYGAGTDDVVIGMVCRINANKGINTFLQAARILAKQYAHVRFVVVGGPRQPTERALFENYQADCAKWDSGGIVSFLGFRSDARDLYYTMDIVCACSLQTEGMNNTILEAMAAGRPAVVSQCGGQPELIVQGETGFVFPPGDADALARNLEQFINDRDLRRLAGVRARVRFERSFCAARFQQELVQLIASFSRTRRRASRRTADSQEEY